MRCKENGVWNELNENRVISIIMKVADWNELKCTGKI